MLAYAQYEVTTIDTMLVLEEDVPSTDETLISLQDTHNIHLAPGHTYLISDNIMLAANDVFTIIVAPTYASVQDRVQAAEGVYYGTSFYVASLSTAFILQSGAGGNLSFPRSETGSPSIYGFHKSTVTVMCLE